MDQTLRSPDGRQVTSEEGQNLKVAACLTCRRSKVRCDRNAGSSRCRRCNQLGSECIRPAFVVGRRKGVKNKRKGLEKALCQVEEALRHIGTNSALGSDAAKAILDLKTLLGNRTDVTHSSPSGERTRQSRLVIEGRVTLDSELPGSSSDNDESEAEDVGQVDDQADDQAPTAADREITEERFAVDDAENPLQLLARASNLYLSPQPRSDQPHRASASASAQPYPSATGHDSGVAAVQNYFAYSTFNLDVGPDIDPVCLGLVSEEEAESLFDFFHQNLAHTRWGLDPALYTACFTRSRSAFLFTSIMAAAALFMPSSGALSRRLSNHTKTLADRTIIRRHRSVEIILAFMINVPWMFPAEHSTDDNTSLYVSVATNMSIDLSLHKILLPFESFKNGSSENLARGDCIDPTNTLQLGGYTDVDPGSEFGRRLLRTRERCWLALFVLERGMCLARGRTYTVPLTPFIRKCDNWHISDIADKNDGHLVSVAVLRRDLDGLFDKIRSLCDGSVENLTDGPHMAQSIQSMIEEFFDQWLIKWGSAIGVGSLLTGHKLPPYVEILVIHTRLSVYASVINHPTAPIEVRQVFRTAGLSAALNVMRAAIQGEAQLASMPNNTAIMISFAACFALRLSSQVINGNSSLAPSVRTLVDETADVLERIGSITRHRNGMSTLYGTYLRILGRQAASAGPAVPTIPAVPPVANMAAPADHIAVPVTAAAASMAPPLDVQLDGLSSSGMDLGGIPATADPMVSEPGYMPLAAWPEPFQFSAMSDNQIVEALSRAGNEFETGFGPLHWDNAASLEWMNWPNLPDFSF